MTAAPDRYLKPAQQCPDPRDRPDLDLEAACPTERLQELREIEIESTWRGLPGQRHGRARDGITMLCDIMGHGTKSLVAKALDLFGEEAFRIALHHANPGAIGTTGTCGYTTVRPNGIRQPCGHCESQGAYCRLIHRIRNPCPGHALVSPCPRPA